MRRIQAAKMDQKTECLIAPGLLKLALIIGYQHQIDDRPGYGNVKPNRINNAGKFSVLDKMIRIAVNESQKDKGKAQGSQHDMGNKNKVIYLADPSLPAEGCFKGRKMITNIGNQEKR